MIVGCPTCGAAVEFRYDDSLVRVCGACRSAVVRADRGIETLGRVADLAPIDSPLRLFAEGRLGERGFLLIGVAQLRHAAGGIWQEWYAKLDGGEWAWIAEAQGRYYVTTPRPDTPVPPIDALAPGARVPLGDRAWTVAEVGTGTYASAAGEIPYRLDPRARFRFVDLADGQGGFATIDYGDPDAAPPDAPVLYVGRQVDIADLALHGGEPATPTAAPAQGSRLACPQCGGALTLAAPDRAMRVGCPYCNHLISVASGQLSVIARLAHQARPLIPLGSTATFADGPMTVIGYLRRSALVDGIWYPFSEYLLHAPAVGFRWLVCSDGHWTYVQPVAAGAVEAGPRYDGIPFAPFSRAELRVDEVLGELYWLVAEGERVLGEDSIAPPAMLSCETSPTEQTWSLGTYLTPREVAAAVPAIAEPLPDPTGVGACQPYPLRGAGAIGAGLAAVLCAVGIVLSVHAEDILRHRAELRLPSGTFEPAARAAPADAAGAPSVLGEAPSNVHFTEPFQLTAAQNIQIDLDASIDNSWVYAAVDLVHERTGALVSFDESLEYYAGVTDGESWTEGDRRARQVLRPMPAGSYVIRVEAIHGEPLPVTLRVSVRQDVFRARYWLLAALALAIPFGIVAIHAAHFQKRRWENSQLSPSTEGADSSDDD